MHDNIQKLSAYLDDELNGHEREQIEKALAASTELEDELKRLQSLRDWANNFPGRQPRRDVWSHIENRIAANATHDLMPNTARQTGRLRVQRLLSKLPFYSSESGWSNGARRTAVFGLAGIAIAGMGRSFYQEQRANLFEEKGRLKDEQLVRATTDAAWSQSATGLRGQIGRRLTIRCAQNGNANFIWGTDIYTDDSSICTAAVHAGLIDFETGGLVQIEIRPGRAGYAGISRNGVTSYEYDEYGGSFTFIPDERASRFNFEFLFDTNFSTESTVATIGWDRDAEGLRGLEGTHHSFRCVAGDPSQPVWGSGPYTDDSSICTAAVHAGLIAPDEGGVVTVAIGGKHPRFTGSERNGVETRSFGSWDGTFMFLDDESVPIGALPIEVISWDMSATSMRGWDGFQTTMSCPADGEHAAVWGAGPYTDDSSICTAAVHAGLITFEDGGPVTVEIGPGLEDYVGEFRNGVNSHPYGNWSGSFRFAR